MIIKSKRIITEEGIIDGYIIIENKVIKEIALSNRNLQADLDVGNMRIIPGIVDCHNHGTQGYSLMDEIDEAGIRGYLKGLASQGVTAVFPTCSVNLIKKIAEFSNQDVDGAKIVGIHSEGPWLNRVGEKGVKTTLEKVSVETAQKMIVDGKGKLRLVALAPEIPGIEPIMKLFVDNGIKVAIAHSDMNYKQSIAAINAGASVATHLGNVMTGLHHRDVGVFGACLLNEKVDCELICDGLHICLEMLTIILKVKAHHQIMMISDCTAMAGAPVGRYKTFIEGVNYINVDKQGFVLSDTGRLCGSSKGIIYGIKNLVEQLHLPIEEVVKMSSLNACNIYGIKNKGSLKAGNDADLVIIDDNYDVLKTFSEGKLVYDVNVDQNVFNPEFLKENLIE